MDGDMVSFVAEVLSSAGQLEREEMNEKLSVLGRRMEKLKLDILQATTDPFTDFDPSYEATLSLSEQVNSVTADMEQLSQKINTEIKGQLNVSTGEFQSLSRQLEQVTSVIAVLDQLTKAQQLMADIAKTSAEGRFSQAALCLSVLEEALHQPIWEGKEELRILVGLRTEQKILKQQLIKDVDDAWKEMVAWSRSDNVPMSSPASGNPCKHDKAGGKDKGEGSQDGEGGQFELRLPKKEQAEQNALSEVLTALQSLGQLDSKLKTFARQLYTNIFSGLIFRWQKVVVSEKQLPSGRQVIMRATGNKGKPDCVEVFRGVEAVLGVLQESLLDQQVVVEDGGSGVRLMVLLGQEVGEKVVEGVKECLTHAIPSSAKELEEFHVVAKMTEQFHEKLESMGFMPPSCRTLLDFVQNVNVLFANKKCQTILEQARALMTSDIHSTVQISSEASAGELPPLDKSGGPSREKSRKVDLSADPLLSDATFRMPTCRVSECVQEILDLVYATLNEAASSSPQCAAQMFYATRNIFELFCSVFPTYHAHSLANFPQVTALHHNNCMYLAHHLLTLGHQFRASLPKDVSATFVDLIPEIRGLGTSSFLDQINTQKGIIEQYLQGAGGFAAVDEESSYSAAERSLRQVLHQLSHLQKVWHDVLPVSNYHKAIGLLLNGLVKEVSEQVIALEDISSDAACKLSVLLALVRDKGGSLFVDPNAPDPETEAKSSKAKANLLRHVPRWQKFSELQLVLTGTLQGIADRWAEGKGPLAAEFAPNEVKQLIRALFQNTDRRAAVLAKIK